MARTYTVILPVRFTPDEAAELARKASLMRLRRGTFLRQAALAAPFASRIDREVLRRLGFARLSARPRHPQGDSEAQALYKRLR